MISRRHLSPVDLTFLHHPLYGHLYAPSLHKMSRTKPKRTSLYQYVSLVVTSVGQFNEKEDTMTTITDDHPISRLEKTKTKRRTKVFSTGYDRKSVSNYIGDEQTYVGVVKVYPRKKKEEVQSFVFLVLVKIYYFLNIFRSILVRFTLSRPSLPFFRVSWTPTVSSVTRNLISPKSIVRRWDWNVSITSFERSVRPVRLVILVSTESRPLES